MGISKYQLYCTWPLQLTYKRWNSKQRCGHTAVFWGGKMDFLSVLVDTAVRFNSKCNDCAEKLKIPGTEDLILPLNCCQWNPWCEPELGVCWHSHPPKSWKQQERTGTSVLGSIKRNINCLSGEEESSLSQTLLRKDSNYFLWFALISNHLWKRWKRGEAFISSFRSASL